MTEQNETQETEDTTQDITSLTLDNVFDESDDDAGNTVEVAEEKGETEEEEAEAKAEETESEEVETPATKEAGQTAALLAERKKRQKAEDELRRLREEKQKIPDPIDDPEGYKKYLDSDNDRKSLQTRISLSRDVMIEMKEDFAEMEKVFMGLVSDADGNVIDESLLRKFQSASNPAKFAYQTAKDHLEIQNLRDPAYLEKIRAEAREEGRKEALAELKTPKKRTAIDVPDLTSATASGKNSTNVAKVAELDDVMEGSQL